MTQPFKTIIDYVVEYISKLPADHPANRAFGARLTYFPEDELVDESNVFAFRFPVSDYTYDTADIMGDVVDVATTNRSGICVLPAGGGAPDANMGCYYPYFVIRCRHKAAGVAFNTLQALTYELQDNARVFPQNGTIRSLSSQPGMVWADQQLSYVFQSEFRVIAAEQVM